MYMELIVLSVIVFVFLGIVFIKRFKSFLDTNENKEDSFHFYENNKTHSDLL